MPTYEFVCSACGHKFDSRCSIAERDQLQRCPNCGSSEGRRKLTACAVQGGQRGSASGGGCAGCGGKNCSTCH